MKLFPDFDPWQVITHLVQLGTAFLLALPLGWDREQSERSLGVRTFPLIALASCGFLLTGATLFGHNSEGASRVLEGAMTGVGFLGGGVIIKQKANVRGTATAAAIWITAAIGAAVAFNRYEIAIPLSMAALITLRWLGPIKRFARSEEDDSLTPGAGESTES